MPVWLVFDGLERFPCEVPLGCLFIPNKNLEPPGWCQEDDVPDLEVANFWVPNLLNLGFQYVQVPPKMAMERERERAKKTCSGTSSLCPVYANYITTTARCVNRHF